MRKSWLVGAAFCGLLAGCSEAGNEETYETLSTVDVAERSAAPMAEAAMNAEAPPPPARASEISEIAGRSEIPVSMPKMAYVYDFGFRMEGEKISALQQKHADMCSAMGPYSCQIVSLSHSGAEADYVTGQLQLAVAADKARDFGKKLAGAASDAGGEEIASTIQGEDLSKAIVDTEARLRTRIVLRDRLLEVLRTRNGKVSELVEAERGVAQVNEEIDRARSWLEEMKGRVAYSRINVSYESGTAAPGGFAEPIRAVFSSLGSIMGTLVAGIILLLALGLPLAAIVFGLRKLWKRIERRPEAEAAA